MAGYIGNKSSVVSSGAERKFKFTITETTTTLSNLAYTPNLVHVFHNGIRLVDGTDYTATNGTSITLANAAEDGDEVVVISYASFQTSDTVSASLGGFFEGNVTINADLTVSGNTDINGGAIDGTVIGGSTPAAISGTTITATGDVDVADKITHSGDTDTALRFPAADTVTVETAGSERVRVDSSGNVGIGTSSPAAPLHVFTTGGEPARFVRDLATDTGLSIQSDNSGPILDTVGVHNLRFFTGAAERMRIDASGNLLVGTTTAYGQVTSQCDSTKFSYASHNTDTTGVSQLSFRFVRNAADVGSITTTSSATAYNTSSDYRLKEDVQPMVGASDRLMALKPVNFAWKVDGSRVDGFLAHEAQEVVPEAVVGTKDAVDADGNPEYQGIDQSKIVPLLTAALQEALTKINDQQSALELLEARVAQLEGGAA